MLVGVPLVDPGERLQAQGVQTIRQTEIVPTTE